MSKQVRGCVRICVSFHCKKTFQKCSIVVANRIQNWLDIAKILRFVWVRLQGAPKTKGACILGPANIFSFDDKDVFQKFYSISAKKIKIWMQTNLFEMLQDEEPNIYSSASYILLKSIYFLLRLIFSATFARIIHVQNKLINKNTRHCILHILHTFKKLFISCFFVKFHRKCFDFNW